MTIELDHHAVTTAVSDLRAGADSVHDARRRAAREVDALLDGGWTGVAADSFAAGWADWQAAAGDVLEGLLTMAQLLGDVHVDLTDRDTDAQAGLTTLTQQLTGRLG